MAKSKKEMVKTGKIEDARIFKLMYLEKSVHESQLLSELKKRAYNDQIEQLKAERQTTVRGFELRVRELTSQVASIRKAFEDDYDIKLSEWGYDDVTGILVPLSPDVVTTKRSQEALQKDIDSEKSEEKKKRKGGKRTVRSKRWENTQSDAGGGEDEQKPPAKPAEV